jgi:TonB family protein
MAHQPIPFPAPDEQEEPVNGSHSPARNFALVEPASVWLALAEDMAVLREQLGTDGLDLDAFLDQIVKHARALTCANGAAIALRQGSAILCRARCGQTSPPLGAQLDADFGISGECLRTGKALRCEDSERDLRLDPEVCRQLGLRSIAVVPIFEWTTVAGILEVFASHPHAFDDRHLEILQQLAELVTTVSRRVTQENQDLISEGILGPTNGPSQTVHRAELNSYGLPSRSERLRNWAAPMASRQNYAAAITRLRNWTAPIASRRYYAAAIAVFALAGLLAILGWKLWSRTERVAVASTKTRPQAETVPASAAPTEIRSRLNSAQATAVGRNVTSRPTDSPTPSDPASNTEAQNVALVQPMSGMDESKSIIVVPSSSRQTRDRVVPAEAQEPIAPIVIGVTSGFGQDANVLGNTLSVQPNLPNMVSQGVSGGLLERKVQPIYPAEARSKRLQGPVVLQAVIDEFGNVRNLRTVSGDSILARAAMDAVRQWHYQPYRLNGQAVKTPTQITVNFTLP